MSEPTYLDYNATAPMRPEVRSIITENMELPLNASSVHSYGRKGKQIIQQARQHVAETLNCWPAEIIWLSSASEANNTVLTIFSGQQVWISAIEHPSVLKAAPHAKRLAVTADGAIDLEALKHQLETEEKPALISVMMANNETGVMQPVGKVSKLARQYGVPIHIDAVQGVGKLSIDVTALRTDYMTLSTHKCGGPVGIAALIVRQGSPYSPLILGGGQESNRRAGTESVAAIAGFAKALELATTPEAFAQMELLRSWLDAMEATIQAASPDVIIVGKEAPRLAHVSCVSMPDVSQETQLMRFDLEEFMVSAGSACSSGRIEPSHVLKAMGISEQQAATALRISAGWQTTEKQIKDFTACWLNIFESLSTSQQQQGAA